MIYRTRTILFLILLVLFLTAASLTILYSLGWRFDWNTKSIIQPGVFYFKVWPKNVEIYLTPLDSKHLTGRDAKLNKKTDFFFGSVLIENLKPKKYNVEIKKDGFYIWRKDLEIKKREVTEAKNIVLVPKDPKFNLLNKNVEAFFFSTNDKKIILKEKTKEGWALKLLEVDKNVKSHLISKGDISQEEVELFDLKFSPDSKTVLLELGFEEKIQYYLLEIDKTPPVLTSLDPLEKPEEFFLPSPLKKEAIALTIFGDDVYYLDDSGFLFKNEIRLNLIPYEIKKETKYEITASGPNIILQENDILYIFDENTKSFQKLFQPIKNFQFSPDWQRLFYANGHEVWVLFLEKSYNQPQREKGEKLFIARFSEELNDIFWYTNHYLIFKTNDKIKIAEIDDRDKINIVDLAEFKSPEIFWANKKLYVLSETNLYVSEELIP